ncbi:hypothetical protein H5410_026536 [Solanum commersonii]|uniref:Uncharacterized protein n=1 Tax=Solanum commersonii TaxID=4109 RepID=A0A9J5Z0Z2_SOLCO|nr:hypothetical protein H5410_026536 [Solanum commersonii]
MGTFEKLGLKHVVKTTEETITIDSDHQTFRLLTENDLVPYRDIYRFMHIGLVQVAFMPLTLRGLPESFIPALRDGRNHNWKKSLIGTIQTSLAYRPIYFNAYPNLQISLQDENSLSSLMLNVKLHGYDYMPSTEVVCICYRIYYNVLHTLNLMCKVIDFKNEIILIETNFGKSKVVTRRPIKWEEIDFPQEWIIEGATQPKNNSNEEISEIDQLNDGTIEIRFSNPNSIDNQSMSSRITRSNSSYISPVDYIVQLNFDHKGNGKVDQPSIQPPPEIEDFKLKDFSDLENFLEITFKGNNLKPLKVNNQEGGESSKKMEFLDEINMISEKVMELPECNSTHWKSKFIDGLPSLFAERVRKSLRGKSDSNYSSQEESSASEDLKALHQEDYMSSKENCLPYQQGLECNKEGEKEDDLYKIYSQFKEMSINVIDNDKII